MLRHLYPLYYLVIPLLIAFILVSCQKEINIKSMNYDKKLVIEGYIENGQVPIVMISRSVPYFDKITLNTLMTDVLVTDAVVTVTSSDGDSEQLQLGLCDDSPVYVAYTGNTLRGEVGKKYHLKVEWKGKTYTAETSIVTPPQIDSIWLHSLGTDDTTRIIRTTATDDPNSRDYYIFQVKVHNRKWHDNAWVCSSPISIDDATFNGMTLNYDIIRAAPSTIFTANLNDTERRDRLRYEYIPGDTIYTRSCKIDEESFQFWSAMNFEILIGSNPFMSSAPVPCNIHGENVLGNWCGFASVRHTFYYTKE